MTSGLDNVTFQVVKNSLISAAEEMKIVLAKTAYSPLLKLAGDYSCGIFDVDGNMVAQGPDIPIHLGSMPHTVRAILSVSGEVAPGDVFIHNDPYFGGSHLPDVNVVAPIYLDDKVLLGYTCVRAHWPDIGGASPGSYGATSEIYGEGLRLPGVRLYTQGRLNPTSTPSSSPMCAPPRSAVATSVPSLPPTSVAQCECRRSPRSTALTSCWA